MKPYYWNKEGWGASEITALPFRDFLSRLGLTQAELSRRYQIPRRTVEDWTAGRRKCAPWVMLLLAESQGLYTPHTGKEKAPMKHLIVFEKEPDYIFGSDELDTVLAWPEPEKDAFRTREMLESGEVVDLRFFGYPIPRSVEEYEEILKNTAGTFEVESV